MAHPSSNVLLGLFHWGDPEKPPVKAAAEFSLDVHDPIARIMINVADSIPETTYTWCVSALFFRYPFVFIAYLSSKQSPDSILSTLANQANVDKIITARLQLGFE
jgi:hypothetical protein